MNKDIISSSSGLQNTPSVTTQAEPLWMKDIKSQEIINDKEFTFRIGIFVEASPQYYGIIEMLNDASENGIRWKIKIISKEYIKKVVQNNFRSNGYKPFKQLCTEIIRYAGYNLDGKIPSKLVAYFILYELRRLKNVLKQIIEQNEVIEKRNSARLQQALSYDSSKLKDDTSAQVTGTRSGSRSGAKSLRRESRRGSTRSRSKSIRTGSRRESTKSRSQSIRRGSRRMSRRGSRRTSRRGSRRTSRRGSRRTSRRGSRRSSTLSMRLKRGGSSSDYGIRRPESELCTRIEERDIRFIDDFPRYGPHVYIAITTIYDPQLPAELIEVLGMPVNCVVKVGTELEKEKDEEGDNDNMKYQEILRNLTHEYYNIRRNKRRPFEIEKINSLKEMEISNFWKGYTKNIQPTEKTPYYASTILAMYKPSLEKINFEDENWKENLKKLLYNEISYALYNQFDLNYLYEKYMKSMEITELEPSENTNFRNMDLYNGILELIPNESINIPIIFDCLIAQISNFFNEDTGYEDIIANNQKKEKTVRQNNLLNSLKELNITYDVLTIKNNAIDLKPRTIFYNDLSRLKSYHIGESSKFITKKTFHLLSLRYKNLFKDIKQTSEQKKVNKKHMHIFRNAIGIRSRKKLSEFLIIMAIINKNPFGAKNSSGSKTKEHVEMTETANHYLIEETLNDICTSSDRENNQIIQNLNTIEEMQPEILVQILFQTFITHNTCETLYVPLLDGFLYKFYNCPKNHYNTQVIQTPITLRDFIQFSLPEEKEWANQALAENQKSNILENFQSDLHLLENQIIDPIEAPVKITPKLNIDSNSFGIDQTLFAPDEVGLLTTHSASIKEEPSFQKKMKSEEKLDKKETLYQQAVTKIYNVGPGHRMQYYSRIIEAMFRHGTKIKIYFQHQLYEKKIINLELETCGHRVYYSSNLNANEDPIKLLIYHRTGIIFSFQQKEYNRFAARYSKLINEESNTLNNDTEIENERSIDEKKENAQKSNLLINDDVSNIDEGEELERCQIKPSPHPFINRFNKFSFSVSWPSGYLMECLSSPNSKLFYIKQSYLTKGPSCKLIENELYRLNLHNNNVIKFMENKTYEILFPTGKKIVCLKYIWKKIRKQKRNQKTGVINESETKNILPVHYKIYHNDGRVISMKNGEIILEENISVRHHTDVLNGNKVSEMANGTIMIQKSDSSQIVEFNDGTRFTSQVHIDEDEVFCDRGVKKDSKFENEGYTSINITVFVEHPNFATIYNNTETKTTVIRFPMSTTMYLYPDETYDIVFASGMNMSIKKDRFVFDKFLNNSLFQHTVIMPNALKFNEPPDPPLIHFLTSDIYGNELKIDTTNFIHYRYALSEENQFCLKDLTDNVKYFFLRHDLSGIEVFPQCRLQKAKQLITKVEDSYTQEFWNTPFKDTIFLFPTINSSENWIMPYSTQLTVQKHNEPSTYGESWIFPFKTKQKSYFDTPKTLTMRIIKTLICEDINEKFKTLIEEYKHIIDENIYNLKCKCQKRRPWDEISYNEGQEISSLLYKNGNVIIKQPGESFMNYVREYIVLHAARVAIQQRKKSKLFQRYNKQRTAILKKEIPPYFCSSFGTSYLITKEIRSKTNQQIEEKEFTQILDILLDKDINSLNNEDIEDMTYLLKILAPEFWKDEVSIKNVVKAGMQLKDNFNNMREVLKYHIGINKLHNS